MTSGLSKETSAIVLDARDYRETSQLLVLLTREYGRVEAVARGSRRVKGGVLDRFCLIHATWRRSQSPGALVTLGRWEIEEEFGGLRSSFRAYLLASIWAESLIVLLHDGAENVQSFDLTLDFFCQLAHRHHLPAWSDLFYYWRLLQVHGFVGPWAGCGRCGAESGICGFSLNEMTVLCDRCVRDSNDLFPISELLWRNLRREALGGSSDLRVPDACVVHFFTLYGLLFEHLTDRKPPSLALLQKTFSRDS